MSAARPVRRSARAGLFFYGPRAGCVAAARSSGQETGFLHTHKCHEELYFFLGGTGEFQVDGHVFPVAEGSVVRVAPAGRRSVRNNGTEPLKMLCVQYRSASFTEEDAADGEILPAPVVW